jgi:hypothetical protein
MPDRNNAALWGGQSVADACNGLRAFLENVAKRRIQITYQELAKALPSRRGLSALSSGRASVRLRNLLRRCIARSAVSARVRMRLPRSRWSRPSRSDDRCGATMSSASNAGFAVAILFWASLIFASCGVFELPAGAIWRRFEPWKSGLGTASRGLPRPICFAIVERRSE